MALRCKFVTLTNSPYTKTLNKNTRTYSYNCGFGYPCQFAYPVCDNDQQSNAYQWRKYGHDLPGYKCVQLPFDSLYNLPTDVFRCTDGEDLGPGAGKCRVYKNPEYFSFHHMTYYDMHLILRLFRRPCIPTGRKPI